MSTPLYSLSDRICDYLTDWKNDHGPEFRKLTGHDSLARLNELELLGLFRTICVSDETELINLVKAASLPKN